MAKAKTVLFRVDANSKIGMGHLMRCIALAQAFKLKKINPLFLLDAQTCSITQSLSIFKFESIEVDEQTLNGNTISYLMSLVGTEHISPALLILDGYQYSQFFRRQLKQALNEVNTPFAIVDDNGGEKAGDLIYADIIINPTCAHNAIPDYQQLAPTAKVLAGEAYRLLRQEFVEQAIIRYQQRNGIVLTMGGADPLNYSQVCLNVLQQMQYKQPVTVLIGNGFKYKKELTKQIAQLPKNFSYLFQADNIAKVFANAELVISAAGGTQFELYAMQTPAILLVSFDNQWRNSQAAKHQGWAQVLDCRQQINLQELKQAFSLVFDKPACLIMHKAMQNARADGAEKLALALVALINHTAG